MSEVDQIRELNREIQELIERMEKTRQKMALLTSIITGEKAGE